MLFGITFPYTNLIACDVCAYFAEESHQYIYLIIIIYFISQNQILI